MKPSVKYPHVEVQLSGRDGNSLIIMGTVTKAMRRAGISDSEISKFREQCLSGDYYNLIQTCMKWVNVS